MSDSDSNPIAPAVPKKSSLFHTAATFCLWSPLIAFGFNLFMPKTPVQSQADALGNLILSAIVPVAGILAGVFALFGLLRYGKAGILWKSVVGLLIWALLAAAAIPVVLKVQEKAKKIHEQSQSRLK